MSKIHTFIVSTDAVNSYGYRILTEGIDTEQYMRNPVVLYMHNRGYGALTGSEIIGRTVALRKEAGKLLADVEFDEKDEFAKKISEKVERGFIKMASLGADVINTSSEKELILPGQTMETVTKSKMIELSIVDIGGNDEALKLSRDGKPAQLQLINQKPITNMSELRTIALALGKPADTSEEVLLSTINELKLAKSNEEAKTKEWKDKYVALQKSEAESIVNKAVALGLVSEELKDGVVLSFEADHEGQKAKLNKLIEDKEKESNKDQKQTVLAGVLNLGKQGATIENGEGKDTFDYLQKHNTVELRRLQKEEPAKYAELAKDYANGVRYKA